jgi:hypothetical protein
MKRTYVFDVCSVNLNILIEVLSKAHAGVNSDGSKKSALRHGLEPNPCTLTIAVVPFSLYSAFRYLFATFCRVSLMSTA